MPPQGFRPGFPPAGMPPGFAPPPGVMPPGYVYLVAADSLLEVNLF